MSSVSTATRQHAVAVNADLRGPRTGQGIAMALFDSLCWAVLFGISLAVSQIEVAAAVGALAGVFMARLFVTGHDACHGSLLRLGWQNRLAGRLLFLPTLTPYSCWELGHNVLHHSFTNLRTHDYVYAPFDVQEFAALPGWRRFAERCYRSAWGLGLFYMLDIWWRRLLFPSRDTRPFRRAYWGDSALVAGFFALELGAAWYAGQGNGRGFASTAGAAVLLPFGLWNYLMGFVTYQHHTNPSVAWFDRREEWETRPVQLECTVHVEFPAPLGLVLGNIMEHTAHHVDVKLSMWSLPEAQSRLEQQFDEMVPRVSWTWAAFADTIRRCKLYDYRVHRWTDFEGNYTSQRTTLL